MSCPYNTWTVPDHDLRIAVWLVIANHDNAVNMIGHDCESIERHLREMTGDRAPAIARPFTGIAQPHVRINNRTEYRSPVVSADRDEIRTVATIIILTKANGAAAATSDAHVGTHPTEILMFLNDVGIKSTQ